MSVTKRVDSNLFKFLMAHVDKHIPGDLGNKTHWQSETKANASETNCTRHFLRGFIIWAEFASHPGSAMITKRMEAVRMNCVLPAVPLLVWFGGVSRREWLPGSRLTDLARLSSKHKVNFCWMKIQLLGHDITEKYSLSPTNSCCSFFTCRDLGEANKPRLI